MSERRLTLINGGPGTDTLRVGRALEQQDQRHIEFISMDDLVRRIGTLAVSSSYEAAIVSHLAADPTEPIDPELAYDLAYEAFESADMKSHILLEGFPQHQDQINHLYELAEVTQRKLTGMIETTTNDSVAL